MGLVGRLRFKHAIKAAGRKPSGIDTPAHTVARDIRNRTARAVPLRITHTIKAEGRKPSGYDTPAHTIARVIRYRTARAVPLRFGFAARLHIQSPINLRRWVVEHRVFV